MCVVCGSCGSRRTDPGILIYFPRSFATDPSTPFGFPATLSEFLTGVNNLPDPQEVGGLPPRSFDDLARREIDIQQVAGMTCMGFQAVNLAAVQASLRSTGKLPPDLFAGTVHTHHLVPVGVSDFKRNIITEVH